MNHSHKHPQTHPHPHAHEHEHAHDHGKSHSHGQGHGHDRDSDSKPEMSTKQKLAVLLSHWVDHNDSHKDNFYSWAEKAEQAGLDGIAAHLRQAGDLSEQVTQQLRQAEEKLDG